MERPQTTKQLARRIDASYVRRPVSQKTLVRALILVCILGPVVFWSLGTTAHRNGMISPGHVSRAHAMWENNCAVCHTHDEKGGFRRSVSDVSCLQCHSAAAHHPSQLVREGDHQHDELALAVHNSDGSLRSANCVECHVEHRGEKPLSLVEDVTCTQCHKNINAALAPGATVSAITNVTSFDKKGGHPWFGREWAGNVPFTSPPTLINGKSLIDPTHLKFNHKVHMPANADPARPMADNCTQCHQNENGRYMRPISYENNCRECHQLKLPGGAILPHVDFALVQGQVRGIDEFYLNWLIRLPPPEREKILADKDKEQWAKESASQFRSSLSEWAGGLRAGSLPGAGALEAELIALPDDVKVDPEAAGKDVRVVNAFLAYGMGTSSCVKCHDLQYSSAGRGPATLPATAPALGTVLSPPLSTVPTGITSSPRRWFGRSTFDHQAHQNMTCVGCHSGAKQSTLTSDVLSPNLIWTALDGSTRSCADCHHPPRSNNLGAGASCVTCHTFHDPNVPTSPAARQISRQ